MPRSRLMPILAGPADLGGSEGVSGGRGGRGGTGACFWTMGALGLQMIQTPEIQALADFLVTNSEGFQTCSNSDRMKHPERKRTMLTEKPSSQQ